ncbi:manganese-dependent inorganic pyrophosphatase [Rubellimicrobium sp. CFH 75288]|uniref:manganese-dependent inorganic pyrophosphatase n=1 Tax=Rubellimicrobium sp. CFH 75288 TaxID=2697034 RepID=UPI00141323D7|nr:manganese-dependent inorganic pyrophosphatase [Rubellimicrobium sp. CFH 75288]NAZ36507.1 manganese-dependent inorganic pyrophosphatase [Rubellimicrobium sp. CFH 75288]
MTTFVFGHKSPDTDSTASAIVWAWHLGRTGETAEARLLGEPNTEAAFVLEHWGFERPALLDHLEPGQKVVIVDTNNIAELPETINDADIRAIIDHHKLVPGLETRGPIDVTIRPLACTATILWDLMGEEAAAAAPEGIKGLALSCILSDTLAFRSPTTTPRDRALAERLAGELGVDIPGYSSKMFAAKSDVSRFSAAELLRMDSKEYTVDGVDFRVSVLETVSPEAILARKAELVAAMPKVALEDGAQYVLLFVVDILREEATMLVPDDLSRTVAEKTFGVRVEGDTVVLPGIMSRKKQIIPALKVR